MKKHKQLFIMCILLIICLSFYLVYAADSADFENCFDNIDNNGDGLIDCDDLMCELIAYCNGEYLCTNGIDDDSDGYTDCYDSDCNADLACATETCNDNIDNDGNGLIDCSDPDCIVAPNCFEGNCMNNIDDDTDGDTDCDDSDCSAYSACIVPTVETSCTNNIDDDSDGDTDCSDSDCISNSACIELICTDGLDNDGDGNIDCDDIDCAGECNTEALVSPMMINQTTTLSSNIVVLGIDGIQITEDYVVLDCNHHTITGDGTNDGIQAHQLKGITIKNCIIRDFGDGIDLRNTNNSFFNNNEIQDMSNDGIYARSGNYENTFEGNDIINTGEDGIDFHMGNGNIVQNNYFSNIGRHGIKSRYSYNINIEGNYIEDTGVNGILFEGNSGSTIQSNIINRTGEYNIRIGLISNNVQILGNVLENSGQDNYNEAHGVFSVNSQDLVFQNNNLSNHKYGFYTRDGVGNVYENNIITSVYDAIRIRDSSENIVLNNNRLCYPEHYSLSCNENSLGATGENNFGDTVLWCDPEIPTNAFHTCFEQDACNDQLDNDGDGLVDCMDEDCNYQRCGESSICFENLCTDVRNTDIPTATTVPIEVLNPVISETYYDFFTFLNTGIVVSVPISNSGICNDVCATNGKICGFAQGGMNTCSEIGSEYCTCY